MKPETSTIVYCKVPTVPFENGLLPLELEDAAPKFRHRKRPIYAIVLFAVTTMFLYADQNLLAPNLSQVAQEFGFSDEERDRKLGGDISLAFFLLGVPASLLIGCLGDQYNRMILTACTIGLGEGACLATYFVRTYHQLYICRALTGLSLGGALPIMYSVLGDWFPAEDRHVVTAIVSLGTGMGISLGQGISGFTGPKFGWRFSFLVISVPALVCAILLALTVQDPERGSVEKAVLDRDQNHSSTSSHGCVEDVAVMDGNTTVTESSTQEEQAADLRSNTSKACCPNWRAYCRTLLHLLSTRTFVLSLLQGAPGCVPWGIVNTFLNDFLSNERGMSVEGATLTILCFGVGNAIGMTMSGVSGNYLYRKHASYPPLFAGTMAIFGCVPFLVLLNSVNSNTNIYLIAAIGILAGSCSAITGPIVKATVQNVTLPNTRGQAFALFNTFDDFGRGLGPMFVSLLIVRFGNRTVAFNIGVLGWVFCGFFNLCMYFFVEKDELRVQRILSTNISR